VHEFDDPAGYFSDAQWLEIAKLFGFEKPPNGMKQKIGDALWEYDLSYPGQTLATDRKALNDAIRLTRDFICGLSDLLGEPIFMWEIDNLEEMIRLAKGLQRRTNSKLKKLPKSQGGRPLEGHRDTLVQHLIEIFTEYYSGPHSRLKRSRASDNPDRLIPGGPPYEFVCTILRLRSLPTKGVDHVIARAQQPILKKE
jgi:hypothetical protein